MESLEDIVMHAYAQTTGKPLRRSNLSRTKVPANSWQEFIAKLVTDSGISNWSIRHTIQLKDSLNQIISKLTKNDVSP